MPRFLSLIKAEFIRRLSPRQMNALKNFGRRLLPVAMLLLSCCRHLRRIPWIVCFFGIHSWLLFLWRITFGWQTYDYTYPRSRTNLVVFVQTVPAWALCRLISPSVANFIWSLIRRGFQTLRLRIGKGYQYRMEALPVKAPSGEWSDFDDRKPSASPVSPRRSHNTFYIGLIVLYLFVMLTYENPGDHRFKSVVNSASRYPRSSGYGKGEKVLLAANFYNNEAVLPHWTQQMMKVARYIGKDNVHISIVESFSDDKTPELLEAFEKKLTEEGFRNRVIVRDETVPPPDNRWTNQGRIDFLAAVRNRAIEPLLSGEYYDRVIFSNDVFVQAESVVELLNTRDGDYDMVCGIDTGPSSLYDIWVVRDRFGSFLSSIWPYMKDEEGQRAVWWDEATPSFACWGGIAAFRADPFLPIHVRKPGVLSTAPLPAPLSITHPAHTMDNLTSPALTPPLVFRSSGPLECFSSECLLMPYDLRRQFLMNDILINPRVVVSYEWRHYVWYKYVTRHWLVVWWMKNIEVLDSDRLEKAMMIHGGYSNAVDWDGGKCMIWW